MMDKNDIIIDVTDPGSPYLDRVAPGADVRTDLPKYRIYRKGVLEAEVTSIEKYWQDDLVAFLIGCSFTFEHALMEAGFNDYACARTYVHY